MQLCMAIDLMVPIAFNLFPVGFKTIIKSYRRNRKHNQLIAITSNHQSLVHILEVIGYVSTLLQLLHHQYHLTATIIMIELNNLPVLELSTKGDTMRDKVNISEKYHCLKLQAMCDNVSENCQIDKNTIFQVSIVVWSYLLNEETICS